MFGNSIHIYNVYTERTQQKQHKGLYNETQRSSTDLLKQGTPTATTYANVSSGNAALPSSITPSGNELLAGLRSSAVNTSFAKTKTPCS